MEKKKIGYILFAVAAGDLIITLIAFFIFRPIALRMGIPSDWVMTPSEIISTGLITVVILVVVGLYLCLKYRDE
ncbi:MAG: hypothetical protein ACFE9C_18170 [Candidatus Hodarchaeota archaeon]